jgi:hypothetical protein
MAKTLYESLFEHTKRLDPGGELIAALAQAGRLRRAAEALADDEMREGVWVDPDVLDEQEMRFAADDRDATDAVFSGGGYAVLFRQDDLGAWTAEQTLGAAGASLRLGPQWIPLTPAMPVSIAIDALVSTWVLVDLNGAEITLTRD